MDRFRRRPDERGETLVEVLVAVIIMGIAAAAILAGIALAVRAADINRKEANSGSAVRSAAEKMQTFVAMKTSNYKNCATPDAYKIDAGIADSGSYTFKQDQARTWNGTAWGPCTTSSDPGVQRVLLSVTFRSDAAHPPVSESLYLVLRRACNGSFPTPCATP